MYSVGYQISFCLHYSQPVILNRYKATFDDRRSIASQIMVLDFVYTRCSTPSR